MLMLYYKKVFKTEKKSNHLWTIGICYSKIDIIDGQRVPFIAYTANISLRIIVQECDLQNC